MADLHNLLSRASRSDITNNLVIRSSCLQWQPESQRNYFQFVAPGAAQVLVDTKGFQASLAENVPMDFFVREVLSSPLALLKLRRSSAASTSSQELGDFLKPVCASMQTACARDLTDYFFSW